MTQTLELAQTRRSMVSLRSGLSSDTEGVLN